MIMAMESSCLRVFDNVVSDGSLLLKLSGNPVECS